MHKVPEPCLLSHDLVSVSGNPTWKIGQKQGDTASPGRRAVWKMMMMMSFQGAGDSSSLGMQSHSWARLSSLGNILEAH